MQTRNFKSLSRKTARFTFGTWAIGGESTFAGHVNGWGPSDRAESLRTLARAHDSGIDIYDSADVYGNGLSEELLGEAFAMRDESSWVIITKFGNRESADNQSVKDFSPAWLNSCVEGSLRRLRRSTLDVLLLHSPPDDFEWSTYDWEPFERLIQQGKIRAYGVSVRSIRGAVRVSQANFGSVIELPYNLLDRRLESDFLPPLSTNHQTDLISRIPLASGFLSGKYVGDNSFPATDFRSKIPAADHSWRVGTVKKLGFLADLPGGLAVSALRFCLAAAPLTSVIVGLRSARQIEDCLLADELGPLPPEIVRQVTLTVPEIYSGWR